MKRVVQAIERVGFVTFSVIVVGVAIVLVISLMDRHPRRRDSMAKRSQDRQPSAGDDEPKHSDPD